MEELKLILEAVGKLGDAGKDAFIWYLIFRGSMFFIGCLLGIIGILAAYKLLKSVILHGFGVSLIQKHFEKWGKDLKINFGSCPSEWEKVRLTADKINELVIKSKEE